MRGVVTVAARCSTGRMLVMIVAIVHVVVVMVIVMVIVIVMMVVIDLRAMVKVCCCVPTHSPPGT